MDRLEQRNGFMPGVFGRKKQAQQKRSGSSTEEKMTPGASPVAKRIPDGIRNHFIAMAGEFVGTFLFLFMAFAGTQVANTAQTSAGSSNSAATGPNPQQLVYIALSFGFSLAVNAWIFFRVSGGLFNPAVTLGLCLVGAVPFGRSILVFIAQLLGGMASAGVVYALFPGPLAVTTSLGGGTSLAQGVFIEMFLTAQLVFTILMLAVEKHKGTYLAPVGIGLAMFIAELAGVYYTGGSLNPTRSFGPCVANRYFPAEHWIYWVGPLLGACVAAGFYWFIKALEFQTANPGQDFDDIEDQVHDPDRDGTDRPVVQSDTAADRRRSNRDRTRSGSGKSPKSDNRYKYSETNRERSNSRRSPPSAYNNPDLSRAPTSRGFDSNGANAQPQYGIPQATSTQAPDYNSNYLPARDYNEGRAYYEPPSTNNAGMRGYDIRHSGVQRY